MLTALQLANFKAFAEAQRIPIRPLTLIFGPNSSGKSSVIHGLVLGHHANETGDLEAYRTGVGGESVDLGGFRQYIYRRDLDRRMEWGMEIDTLDFKGRAAELFASAKRIQLSVQIGLAQVERMRIKIGFDARTGESTLIKVPTGELIPSGAPEVQLFDLSVDGDSILQASKRRDGKFKIDRFRQDHPLLREVLKGLVAFSTTTETIRPSDYEGLDLAISELLPELSIQFEKFLPQGLLKGESTITLDGTSLVPVARGTRGEDLANAVRLYFPRVFDEMIRIIFHNISDLLARFRYLGPLRSYPPRHLAFSQHHDPNWNAGGGYAWDVVRREESVRDAVNSWLSSPDRMQTPYELVIRELIGIEDVNEPLEKELERIQREGIELEGEPEGEHNAGGVYPVIDVEAEAVRMREALKSADIEKLRELVLVDRRTDTIVSHRDVGIGVSQVLPVLVSAYAYSNKILAMEQPEIHLHPALQSELADVFITSALGDQKNRFVLETHSEHVMLRILRRIRETSERELPDGIPAIRPDDVSVLYVSPTRTGATIAAIPIRDDGEFAERWPQGFFDERAKELF